MTRTRAFVATLVALLALVLVPAALAAPGTPDLEASSDTGASQTDDITNNPTPTFQIANPSGLDVTLCLVSSDSTAAPSPYGTDTSGNSTVSITASTISDGTYKVTAREGVDCSGAPSDGYLLLAVDTSAPEQPKAPVLLSVGGLDGDTTYTGTPIFLVAAESSSTVTLFNGGTCTGTVTGSAASVSGTANVRVAPALADGDHTVSATATDPAGNVSPCSNATDFTVDQTPPTVSTPDLIDDDGSSPDDNLTSFPRPRFTVATETGAVVTIYENGIALGSATAAGGVATVQVREALWLDPGAHCVYAIGVDSVGNPSGATTDLCITVAAGVPPFTSNLGVALSGEWLSLKLSSSVSATATIRVLVKGKVVVKTKRKLVHGKRTKVGMQLPTRVRGARKLVVIATLRSADGRRIDLRRIVRR